MRTIVSICRGDQHYPATLGKYLGKQAPEQFTVLGDPGILGCRSLALFCSVKCPGDLILKTYDLAKQLRQTGITVVGGFHSPMERECLTILLRGIQPVIVCLARRLEGMRMPAEYRQPLASGRLLLLAPFNGKDRRVTEETAMFRNHFVAALANAIFVAHAEPQSKTERFCRDVISWNKPLYVLEGNSNLQQIGARAINAEADLGLLVGAAY